MCELATSNLLEVVKERFSFDSGHFGPLFERLVYNVPTQRDSFTTSNEPILEFLDTKSIATDVLDTNLTLFLRHLAPYTLYRKSSVFFFPQSVDFP